MLATQDFDLQPGHVLTFKNIMHFVLKSVALIKQYPYFLMKVKKILSSALFLMACTPHKRDL